MRNSRPTEQPPHGAAAPRSSGGRPPQTQLLQDKVLQNGWTTTRPGASLSAGQYPAETERDHVAVLPHVVLALNAGLAFGTSLGNRASADEVLEADDLGLDKTLLEIGVDDAGGLRGLGPLRDRPCASFLRAGREGGLRAERVWRAGQNAPIAQPSGYPRLLASCSNVIGGLLLGRE